MARAIQYRNQYRNQYRKAQRAAAMWCGCVLLLLCASAAQADLRVPTWYDEGPAVADWHYRVPVNIPAGANVGSTIEVDVDFISLLDDLNVATGSVTFDSRSPRVVRPNGTLATEQEFTDVIFNGNLDVTGDGDGQVRFLLQDTPAAGDYFIYFDILANGAKPANPATVINGHFEHSNGSVPTRWSTSAVNANGAQNNEVYATNLGQTVNLTAICSGNAATADASPNNSGGIATGLRWHLLGFRNNCEDGSGGNEQIRLSRTITVPSGAAAGVLDLYFQVQSFDGISTNNDYDWIVFSVNGVVVNHNSLSINNAPLPQLRIDNNRLGRNGYGSNMLDFGWKRARLSLAPYQGSTITFRVETRHSAVDNGYRSWIKLDDAVWSRQVATLDDAEAFGVNVIAPNDTASAAPTQYVFGHTLSLSAVVDAGVQQMLAEVEDDGASLVATGIILFDDGTHGDLVAGDGVWRNDGSDPGAPTYTIPGTGPAGSNWRVRVLALDASSAQGPGTDGLLKRPAAASSPENQANFYNIDEQTFVVTGALVNLERNIETLQDDVSASDPKAIPGAWVRYQVRVENQGPAPLDNDSIVITDQVPTALAVCVISACTCSGPSCPAVDPVEFDDSGSPIASGLAFDYALNVTYSVDGVDFTYAPSPDAEGFDANVRYIRIEPDGVMSQPNSGDNAEFDLRYVVRIE